MARGRKATAGEKTGHRKAAADIEPISVNFVPVSDSLAHREPPPDLDGGAADTWRICIAEMAGNRHVREADLPLLRAYVLAYHVHEEAAASIMKHGALMSVYAKMPGTGDLLLDPNEEPIVVGMAPNPAVKVRNDAANQMRYYSDILGLNPLARIRQNLAEVASTSMVLDIRDRLIADMTGR